jgi:putative RecB family exonuclease
MESKVAGIPTADDVKAYFNSVTEALKARGIRPYSEKARQSALQYLQDFNRDHGPRLYPRVKDTEHKLRADMGDFFLHGVVDVLASAEGDETELEIWDYKGSRRVRDDSEEMKNYEFQMRVYAGLYREKNGKYPKRAVLCFVAEKNDRDMKVEVAFDETSIKAAMSVFSASVQQIERRREADDWSPPKQMPSLETCGACDIRWDCEPARRHFKMRYP